MNILLIYDQQLGGVNSIGRLIEKKIYSSNKINIISYYTSYNYVDFFLNKKSLISNLFVDSSLYKFILFLDILKIKLFNKKFNLIHCLNETSSPIAYHFKKKFMIKYIITIHANYSKFFYKKKYHRLAFDESDKIISVSNFTKKYFLNFANLKHKTITVHTGVDIDIFYKLSNNYKKNQIVFVGPIEKERKGFRFLLDLIEKYNKNNFELIIVSNSNKSDQRYKKLLLRLNKTNIKYKIYENIKNSFLNKIYNDSKINFAACSDYDDMYFEGFNLTIIEAYSAGTKSIVSSSTATEEALSFADGYSVKFGDIESLNLIVDKILNENYSINMHNEKIRTHNDFIKDLKNIYTKL